MEIYVLINNETQGPYTQQQIRDQLKTGELQSVDLAAYAGSADWKPLSALVQSRNVTSRTTAEKPDSTGDKSSKKFVTVLVIAVLLLGCAAAGFFRWRNFGKSEVKISVTTPIELGYPNTLAELNQWYREPPKGQNAAEFFQQGFDAMQITDADYSSDDLPLLGKGALPAPGSLFSPKAKAAVTTLVQRNRSAREMYLKALTLDQSRYPIDLTHGFATLLPHLSKLQATAQLSELTAILAAENKQPKDAVDALLVSLAAAQSVRNEPGIVAQHIRVACNGILKDGLERVLSLTTLSAMDLTRLSESLGRAEVEASAGTGFSRAYAGERVMGLAILNLPPDKMKETLNEIYGGRIHEESGDPTGDLALKKLVKNLKPQAAFYEETFNRTILLQKPPFPERLQADEYFQRRVAEARTNDFGLCALLMEGHDKAKTSRETVGLGLLHLAQTAIALERFRAANSHYPGTLAELVPQFLPIVPVDPFNGQAVTYRKNADGYELSSSGLKAEKPITFTVKLRTAARSP